MRYWVQFLQYSVTDKDRLIDACGDRAVYILDGRNDSETMHNDAKARAQRQEHYCRFPAYVICKGTELFKETARSREVMLNYPIII